MGYICIYRCLGMLCCSNLIVADVKAMDSEAWVRVDERGECRVQTRVQTSGFNLYCKFLDDGDNLEDVLEPEEVDQSSYSSVDAITCYERVRKINYVLRPGAINASRSCHCVAVYPHGQQATPPSSCSPQWRRALHYRLPHRSLYQRPHSSTCPL
jgi:hypothetical protein